MTLKTKIIIVLFLCLQALVIALAVPEVSRHFDGSWKHFRAEGLSLGQALPRAPSYLRKYLAKSDFAPDSIRSLSFRQDEIWAADGRGEEIPGGLTIAFAGDIMWIRNNWDGFLDPGLKERLAAMDMVFANLETPVDTAARVPSLLPDYAKYNSSPGLIRSFRRDDGRNIFTALSLANNHLADMGTDGLDRTIAFLQKEGIASTGAWPAGKSHKKYLLLDGNGIKIGFYAAGWGLNDPAKLEGPGIIMNRIKGLAPPGKGEPAIDEIIEVLNEMDREGAEIKIVFLHWGYEYELHPDPLIVTTGRKIAEAGADFVIGTHPHVVQSVEIWPSTPGNSTPAARRSLIAYSLGNFTTAMYTPECRTGMVLPVTLFRNLPGGPVDWKAEKPLYVINTRAGFMGKKRRLMLYGDLYSPPAGQ